MNFHAMPDDADLSPVQIAMLNEAAAEADAQAAEELTQAERAALSKLVSEATAAADSRPDLIGWRKHGIFDAPMELRQRRFATAIDDAARNQIARELFLIATAHVAEACSSLSPPEWAALIWGVAMCDLIRVATPNEAREIASPNDIPLAAIVPPRHVEAWLRHLIEEHPALDTDAMACSMVRTASGGDKPGSEDCIIDLIMPRDWAADSGPIPEARLRAAVAKLRVTKGLRVVSEASDGTLTWRWVPHALHCSPHALPANAARYVLNTGARIVQQWIDESLSPSPGIGHNSEGAAPQPEGERVNALDPGPDKSYRIATSDLIVPGHVPAAELRAFEKALAAQGDEEHRLNALDNARYRARDVLKDHARWKLYSIVSDYSKGGRRCCVLSYEYIKEHGGFSDRAQVKRIVDALEEMGLLAVLRFEVTSGNSRSRVFLAPVVTVQDRLGASIGAVMAAVKERMAWAQKKEAERLREYRAKKAQERQEAP